MNLLNSDSVIKMLEWLSFLPLSYWLSISTPLAPIVSLSSFPMLLPSAMRKHVT